MQAKVHFKTTNNNTCSGVAALIFVMCHRQVVAIYVTIALVAIQHLTTNRNAMKSIKVVALFILIALQAAGMLRTHTTR